MPLAAIIKQSTSIVREVIHIRQIVTAPPFRHRVNTRIYQILAWCTKDGWGICQESKLHLANCHLKAAAFPADDSIPSASFYYDRNFEWADDELFLKKEAVILGFETRYNFSSSIMKGIWRLLHAPRALKVAIRVDTTPKLARMSASWRYSPFSGWILHT